MNGQTINLQTFRYAPNSPVLTLNDPFLTSTGGASVVRPIDVVYLPPDYKDGDVWKWSFDVQRELPWNVIAGVGYAGSKASHIGNSVINWNDPVSPVSVFSQNLRPYPQFFDPARPDLGVQSTGRIRYIDSYGEGFYHGLQVKFDKRTSHDLSFGVSYTYSKSHGDGEAGGQEGASFQNPRDRLGSRGVYSFDQTHRTVANFVWELPGRTMKGFVGYRHWWMAVEWASRHSPLVSHLQSRKAPVTWGFQTGSVRPRHCRSMPNLHSPNRKLWFNPESVSARHLPDLNPPRSLPSLGSAVLRSNARTRVSGTWISPCSRTFQNPRSATICNSAGRPSTSRIRRGLENPNGVSFSSPHSGHPEWHP